jgi:hypothetical protein
MMKIMKHSGPDDEGTFIENNVGFGFVRLYIIDLSVDHQPMFSLDGRYIIVYNKDDLKTFSAVYKKGQIGDETEFVNEYKPLLKNMFFTTPDTDSLREDLEKFVFA